jgi:hypothetical protein
MKNNTYHTKFDWLVLKPLWILFIVIAVYYFFQKAWLIGILMVGMNFWLGIIAANLYSYKEHNELANEYHNRTQNRKAGNIKITDKEYYEIGKLMIKLAFLLFTACLILTIHNGLKWYYGLGVSLLVGWLGTLIAMIPFFMFFWNIQNDK